MSALRWRRLHRSRRDRSPNLKSLPRQHQTLRRAYRRTRTPRAQSPWPKIAVAAIIVAIAGIVVALEPWDSQPASVEEAPVADAYATVEQAADAAAPAEGTTPFRDVDAEIEAARQAERTRLEQEYASHQSTASSYAAFDIDQLHNDVRYAAEQGRVAENYARSMAAQAGAFTNSNGGQTYTGEAGATGVTLYGINVFPTGDSYSGAWMSGDPIVMNGYGVYRYASGALRKASLEMAATTASASIGTRMAASFLPGFGAAIPLSPSTRAGDNSPRAR